MPGCYSNTLQHNYKTHRICAYIYIYGLCEIHTEYFICTLGMLKVSCHLDVEIMNTVLTVATYITMECDLLVTKCHCCQANDLRTMFDHYTSCNDIILLWGL